MILDARKAQLGDLPLPNCGLDRLVELKGRSLEVLDKRVPVGEDGGRKGAYPAGEEGEHTENLKRQMRGRQSYASMAN